MTMAGGRSPRRDGWCLLIVSSTDNKHTKKNKGGGVDIYVEGGGAEVGQVVMEGWEGNWGEASGIENREKAMPGCDGQVWKGAATAHRVPSLSPVFSLQPWNSPEALSSPNFALSVVIVNLGLC